MVSAAGFLSSVLLSDPLCILFPVYVAFLFLVALSSCPHWGQETGHLYSLCLEESVRVCMIPLGVWRVSLPIPALGADSLLQIF